jgi:hypothetical protein
MSRVFRTTHGSFSFVPRSPIRALPIRTAFLEIARGNARKGRGKKRGKDRLLFIDPSACFSLWSVYGLYFRNSDNGFALNSSSQILSISRYFSIKEFFPARLNQMSENSSFDYSFPPPEKPALKTWLKHFALLVVTFFTAMIAGVLEPFGPLRVFPQLSLETWGEVAYFFSTLQVAYIKLIVSTVGFLLTDPYVFGYGMKFSLSMLFILTCHEAGHYIACRIYGVDTTLPYFLPMPPLIGPGRNARCVHQDKISVTVASGNFRYWCCRPDCRFYRIDTDFNDRVFDDGNRQRPGRFYASRRLDLFFRCVVYAIDGVDLRT